MHDLDETKGWEFWVQYWPRQSGAAQELGVHGQHIRSLTRVRNTARYELNDTLLDAVHISLVEESKVDHK